MTGDGRPRSLPSLLESRFPAYAVSRVASADRRARDPAYSAHRWWARRPPALMRAILLAAALDASTSEGEFWDQYADASDVLSGVRVFDPFMGGGSTLIEASRLGASVEGTDVDPTAELIVAHALAPADGQEVLEAGNELLAHLRSSFSALYPADGGEALHWFWLPIVTCPECSEPGPLYRSLVLARDVGKPGAVVRDSAVTVFDPDSFELRYLRSPAFRTFGGSRRRWPLNHATFAASKYQCPACGERSSHRELQTGAAPQRMVAVERTPRGRRRRLVPPDACDLAAIDLAHAMLADPPTGLRLPTAEFDTNRSDPRPRSYGMSSIRDLFTPRQLLVLGAAHAWIDQQQLPAPTERALGLALSNALATNNRLCSYAADYGRLSPLFSVRGYSLPALSVELNPLHSHGGRGSLLHCLKRVVRSSSTEARRTKWNSQTGDTESTVFGFSRRSGDAVLRCSSAVDAVPTEPVDMLVFDPPYYDYISYDELAELFRAWNPDLKLRGRTLQSSTVGGSRDFGATLADCLRPAVTARRPGLPIVFTYHSSNPAAWDGVGFALDELRLLVTAMWPVRSDGHMGHHSHPGNCEWDVIVVCRPIAETRPATMKLTIVDWESLAHDLPVGDADRAGFECALTIAAARWARPAAEEPTTDER